MPGPSKESKISLILKFLEKNPKITQPQLRQHFEQLGIHVSSSESSQAFKKLGLNVGRKNLRSPDDDRKPRKPRSPVVSIPLNESPVLYMKMHALREQNSRLRRVIETLIDEEVDSSLFATEEM